MSDPSSARGEEAATTTEHEPASWFAFVGLAIVLVGAAQLLPAGALRAIVVAPVLLTVPGFLLVRLVLRGTSRSSAGAEVTFAVAFSLALIIADALVINAVGSPLDALTLALGAVASSTLLAALGVMLDVPIERLGDVLQRVRHGGAVTTRTVAVVAAVALAGLAAWVAALALPAPTAPTTVSFSLGVQYARLTEALTTTPGESLAIPVVASQVHGTGPGRFVLSAAVDGRTVTSASVVVPRSGLWTDYVRVKAPAGPALHRVEVMLRSSTSDRTSDVSVYLLNATT